MELMCLSSSVLGSIEPSDVLPDFFPYKVTFTIEFGLPLDHAMREDQNYLRFLDI
jgi:hypothetical protein